MMDTERKICPSCAELIKLAALKCPHCQQSQTRAAFFTSDTFLSIVLAILVLSGFVITVHFLTNDRDLVERQNEIRILNCQMGEAAEYSTDKSLVVFGILTNLGANKLELRAAEIRFFDKDGKLANVESVRDRLLVLPQSENAFRFSLYSRRLSPTYAEVKMYVREAKVARRFNRD